jgi:hypothetical protein
LGNTPTETPILFINQPVGSTCTIVADLYARHGRQPSLQIAGLLLAGIISDTLNGTSPTATATDRAFLKELSAAAGISADDLAAEIFAVGSPLRSLSPGEVIMADAKIYEERGLKFSVSQIEEVNFSGFDEHQENLRTALRERVQREGLFFAALLLTDIKTQDSYLLAEGNAEFLRAINYPEQSEHVWLLEGVVSRKKQLLRGLIVRHLARDHSHSPRATCHEQRASRQARKAGARPSGFRHGPLQSPLHVLHAGRGVWSGPRVSARRGVARLAGAGTYCRRLCGLWSAQAPHHRR